MQSTACWKAQKCTLKTIRNAGYKFLTSGIAFQSSIIAVSAGVGSRSTVLQSCLGAIAHEVNSIDALAGLPLTIETTSTSSGT